MLTNHVGNSHFRNTRKDYDMGMNWIFKRKLWLICDMEWAVMKCSLVQLTPSHQSRLLLPARSSARALRYSILKQYGYRSGVVVFDSIVKSVLKGILRTKILAR